MRNLNYIVLVSALLITTSSAQDTNGRKIVQRQDPEYPQIAKQMNLHGMVKIKVWVTPQGTVRRSEYIGGHPLLAEAAIKAVKDWKYEPVARETTTVVELRF